jgi:hypothetical protein
MLPWLNDNLRDRLVIGSLIQASKLGYLLILVSQLNAWGLLRIARFPDCVATIYIYDRVTSVEARILANPGFSTRCMGVSCALLEFLIALPLYTYMIVLQKL